MHSSRASRRRVGRSRPFESGGLRRVPARRWTLTSSTWGCDPHSVGLVLAGPRRADAPRHRSALSGERLLLSGLPHAGTPARNAAASCARSAARPAPGVERARKSAARSPPKAEVSPVNSTTAKPALHKIPVYDVRLVPARRPLRPAETLLTGSRASAPRPLRPHRPVRPRAVRGALRQRRTRPRWHLSASIRRSPEPPTKRSRTPSWTSMLSGFRDA